MSEWLEIKNNEEFLLWEGGSRFMYYWFEIMFWLWMDTLEPVIMGAAPVAVGLLLFDL